MKQGLPDSARGALARQIAADEHPSADLLTAFAEHSLGAAEHKQLTTHLAACPECREVVFLASAAAPQASEVAAGEDTVSRWQWLTWKWVVPAVASVIVIAAVAVPKLLDVTHDMRNTVAMNAPATLPEPATSTPSSKESRPATAGSTSSSETYAYKQASPADKLNANSGAPGAQTEAANTPKDLEKRKDAAVPAANEQPLVGGPPPVVAKKDEQSRALAAGRANAKSGSDVSNSLVLHQETRDAEAAAAPAPPPPPMMAKAAPPQQGQPSTAAKNSSSAEVSSAAPLVAVQSAEVASSAKSAKLAAKSPLADAAQNSSTVSGLMMAKNSPPVPRWRVTNDGQLQRSVDSSQWTRMLPDQSVVFKAVGVVGPQVWAGGNDGALFRSSNAGESWTRVPLIAEGTTEKATIVSIRFDSPLKGSARTDSGTTWVTSDGGKSWSKQ